ncbi:hypothetical protein [Methylobacter sp. sgz302048]|uniref:hypothetical protein n=1 Tax=Methylobacter sp. sgz302048 TaxID=3455945 RepID=UPI003F9FA894
MKRFIRHALLCGASAACLLGAPFSQAETGAPELESIGAAQYVENTMKFSEPGQYCFEQTTLRGAPDKTILDHHLLIPPEDHLKTGDVFVGFRRNSQPDALWLYNGSTWVAADDNQYPYSKAFIISSKLESVIPTSISYYAPIDVAEFAGDGEIWVGYGLRKDAEATEEDSFQDMISNRRYYRVWQIGGSVDRQSVICLPVTQMTVGTSSSDIIMPGEKQPQPPIPPKAYLAIVPVTPTTP